ncbi:MAG: CDP-alcohol phosphatidyltransferase family protein [Bacteroidota bacterium]
MISVYQIKPAFQKALQPILRGLHKAGITANQITLTAILLSAGLGAMMFAFPTHRYVLLLLPLGLLLRMALNALDGMMARQFQMQSKLGAVLNEVGDVVSDSMIFLALFNIPSWSLWAVGGFTLLAILNEFCGLLPQALGGERRYDGPMGKSDRALLIGLYCILGYFWPSLLAYGNWVLVAAMGLMVLSSGIRLRHAQA